MTANTTNFTANDVCNATNTSSSAVYRYLRQVERIRHPRMRNVENSSMRENRNGNLVWSLSKDQFDNVVSYIKNSRT